MKVPREIAETVHGGNMKRMWDVFISLEEEFPPREWDGLYKRVRFGDKIKFDIYDIWETTKAIEVLGKKGKAHIKGEEHSLEDYRTEKEARRKIMIQSIMENIDLQTKLVPRAEVMQR